jgi:hypothetical protein
MQGNGFLEKIDFNLFIRGYAIQNKDALLNYFNEVWNVTNSFLKVFIGFE